ncbi:MAG: hypothetical protein K6E36_05105 [Oscillospiraceae bacterium]|nr:hypothetical protein [Oscillospiraceae bacterium]MCR5305862.1 hypothetical protein [Oscillospiraceae bacterium]
MKKDGWGNLIFGLALIVLDLIAYFFFRLSGSLHLSWLFLLLDGLGIAASVQTLRDGDLPPKIAVSSLLLCAAAAVFYFWMILKAAGILK